MLAAQCIPFCSNKIHPWLIKPSTPPLFSGKSYFLLKKANNVLREDNIVELAWGEKIHSKCNFDHELSCCKPRNLPHLLYKKNKFKIKRWLWCGWGSSEGSQWNQQCKYTFPLVKQYTQCRQKYLHKKYIKIQQENKAEPPKEVPE